MSNTAEKSTAISPDEIEQKLNNIKGEIAQCQKNYEQAYLEIGRLLLEVKRIKPHGQWIPRIRDNTDFSVCKAQRLMRVTVWADENEAPVPHLDFTKAYLLSRLTGNDLKSFLQNLYHVGGKCAKNVESMTRKELEYAIRNYVKSKGRESLSTQETQQVESHALAEDEFLDRFGRIKSDVSELATLIGSDSAGYGAFVSDLCELCQDIIQRLSPDDVEGS